MDPRNANSTNTINQKQLLGEELAAQLEKEQAEEAIAKRQKEADEAATLAAKSKKKIILRNTLGEEVDPKDYFYSSKGKDTAPSWIIDVIGKPVDREDMLTVFNKIFKVKDGILFYKQDDKEVYVIMVPLKHSSVVGQDHNSVDGEFQKHAISFVSEGSVNLDMLKTKLTRVASTIKIAE